MKNAKFTVGRKTNHAWRGKFLSNQRFSADVLLIGLTKLSRLVLGQMLLALGAVFSIQADIGLAPWDAFSMGLSLKTGLSMGDVVILSGLIIVGIDVLLKEKIGLGTIANTMLIGKFIDLFRNLEFVPRSNTIWISMVMVVLTKIFISLGIYFYVGAGLGCGPRDALMVALGKRLTNLKIGLVRGAMEGVVLLVGWLMGAKVGIGTIISVLGIGFVLQATFQILKFDIKSIRHATLTETFKQGLRLFINSANVV